jgi:hypothetical protein
VWLLKGLDGLSSQLRDVVEKVLSEPVAVEKAKATVRTALTEL